MELEKNTKKIATRAEDGSVLNVIPDAIDGKVVYEIKDTKVVSNTKQIQGEKYAAKRQGKDFTIVTGENTHVTEKAADGATIIRRDDLGPKTQDINK